jgi:hypothetical protein
VKEALQKQPEGAQTVLQSSQHNNPFFSNTARHFTLCLQA